jgi:hypothetical protein
LNSKPESWNSIVLFLLSVALHSNHTCRLPPPLLISTTTLSWHTTFCQALVSHPIAPKSKMSLSSCWMALDSNCFILSPAQIAIKFRSKNFITTHNHPHSLSPYTCSIVQLDNYFSQLEIISATVWWNLQTLQNNIFNIYKYYYITTNLKCQFHLSYH